MLEAVTKAVTSSADWRVRGDELGRLQVLCLAENGKFAVSFRRQVRGICLSICAFLDENRS